MAKAEVPSADDYLTAQDLRALALIKESLGPRAFEQHRLLLLRQHAERIIKVDTGMIQEALDFLDGKITLKKGIGPVHITSRKMVMEDPRMLKTYRAYLQHLLNDGGDSPIICNLCKPPQMFPTAQARSNHMTRGHKAKKKGKK